jgi:radical SAM protein with 4Fe4S-binding SPASM domain
MGFEGFPFIVGWELTLACNLRCRHCGSSAGPPRAKELTLAESLAICDQFPALAVQEVDFTGGEPLLNPHWAEIAEHLAELGIRTKVLTNGVALAPQTVERIKEAGIRAVGVSIDGLERTHDYIRGRPGMFRRSVDAVTRLANAGLSVTVITMANALNLKELPSLLALWREVGVRYWQIQPIAALGRSQAAAELQLSDEAYVELGRFVLEHRTKPETTRPTMIPADCLGYFSDIDVGDAAWKGCSAGIVSCGITSDGKIKGCLSLPADFVEGDLRRNDLWDIWFHSDSFAYTRRFSAERLGPFCEACDKGEQCRGGCSSMSFAATGRLHNDPFCFYGISRRTAASSEP